MSFQNLPRALIVLGLLIVLMSGVSFSGFAAAQMNVAFNQAKSGNRRTASGSGQTRAAPSSTPAKPAAEPAARQRGELTQVRVVVTDRLGKPVNNLTREDFELIDAGRPAAIASVSRAGGLAGRVQGDNSLNATSGVRPVVFFVDTLHLTRERLPRVKQFLSKFVDQHLASGGEMTIATSSGGLGALEQLTRDRALLRRAISRLQAAPAPGSIRESLFTPYLAAAVVRDSAASESRGPTSQAGGSTSERDNVGARQPLDSGRSRRERPLPVASQVSGDTFRVAREVMLLEQRVTASAEDVRNRASEVLAWSTCLRRESLARLRAVARTMTYLPGPRVIVLISDGFSVVDSSGTTDQADLQRTLGTASRSGTVIYALDLKSEAEFAPASGPARHGQSLNAAASHPPVTARPSLALRGYLAESALDLSRGIQELAAGTGGKVLFNVADPAASIEKTLAENSAFYSLGFYSRLGTISGSPALNKPDSGASARTSGITATSVRTLRVRVRAHPEYNVRGPLGYLPVAPASEEQPETPAQKLLKAISESSTMGAIGLSTSSRFVVSQADEGQCLIQVFIDAGSLNYREEGGLFKQELELAVAVLNQTGEVVEKFSDIVGVNLRPDRLAQAKINGFTYTKRLKLTPGFYFVRAGVIERDSERAGTAASVVEIPDVGRGNAEPTDIALSESTRAKPTELFQPRSADGVQRFARANLLTYHLAIHNVEASGSGWQIRAEVFDGERVAFQGTWQPLSTRVLGSVGSAVAIGGTLALGLPTGEYELRVSLKSDRSRREIQKRTSFAIEEGRPRVSTPD